MSQDPSNNASNAGGPAEPSASFLAQLKSFGLVFWIANWMELVERFAYYGLRVVLPVFMVTALERGGPELDHVQKGTIYAVWAIVQSFVPILSGGFADRYGFKGSIGLSTILKIAGYLLMGWSIELAELVAGTSIREARAAGSDRVYEIFFGGAMLLALGTAIFKPGVQGLIAHQMPKRAASLGWGVFYQMVNIGGFLGPLIAAYLRVLDWQYVFVVCALGIALNFIPLVFFAEPTRVAESEEGRPGPLSLLYGGMRGLLEPRLFFFTLTFAGFWLMFYQLFDILPNFIDDWVDSRSVAAALTGVLGEGRVPIVDDGNLAQAWIINFNAFLISFFAFAVGFLTGKVRPLIAIVLGIGISVLGIYSLGLSMNGWWILAAIACFSVGEMSASPTKFRYLASIAPQGKQGQYMGYVNFTVGIGWSVGSVVAGNLYQQTGDKIVLARRYLEEHLDMAAEKVAALERVEVLEVLYEAANVGAFEARRLLWQTYEPHSMWLVFSAIGVASMLLLVVFERVVRRADERPDHPFNLHGDRIVLFALGPITAVFLAATLHERSLGLLLNTLFFAAMLIIALREASIDPPTNGKVSTHR